MRSWWDVDNSYRHLNNSTLLARADGSSALRLCLAGDFNSLAAAARWDKPVSSAFSYPSYCWPFRLPGDTDARLRGCCPYPLRWRRGADSTHALVDVPYRHPASHRPHVRIHLRGATYLPTPFYTGKHRLRLCVAAG